MRVLFVHQNFPAQYRHLAAALQANGCEVKAIGDAANLKRVAALRGVQTLGYSVPAPASEKTHHYVRPLEGGVRRGQAVLRICVELAKRGFKPDVICAHPGWGESLFLKDVFPNAKLVLYCEFFYRARGTDVDFDPEFPPTADDLLRIRVKNAAMLLSMDAADAGVAPTDWQRSIYPEWFQSRISVVHDGIDTDFASPDSEAAVRIPERDLFLTAKDEVVTYVARNLEPYRGFHTFMRAVPLIQRRRRNAHILIVGGHEMSYGMALPKGATYKRKMLEEVGSGIDHFHLHFFDHMPHEQLLNLYRISGAHVYLTYPFVLSWSLLEAMSAGCAVVASDTPPVREVANDRENALLVDFFRPGEIADRVDEALERTPTIAALRQNARQTVIERFDLKHVCLPRQLELINKAADRAG